MPIKFPRYEMMLIRDDDEEDPENDGLIHCGNCLKRGENGTCEQWEKYVPSFGFCHMALDKSYAGVYEEWKRVFDTKK